MNAVVPDVSVAAKWVLPSQGEGFRDQAFELLGRHRDGKIDLIVPDIFWAELGNVLWKAVRSRRISAQHAISGMKLIFAESLPSVPSADLLIAAFDIANIYGRAVYDCMYLALAVRERAELVTADERLANAVGGHMPVKWLGLI